MEAAAAAPTPLPTPHGDSALSRVLRVLAIKPITLSYRNARTALFDGIKEGGIRVPAYSSHENE